METDDKERTLQREKRYRKKKSKKAAKVFLIIFSIIILALCAFFITVKICMPGFSLETIIPREKITQVISFVKEDVLGQTTTQPLPLTTERPSDYDYAESADFAFNTSLQGNQLGNLLNNTSGAVTYSASYIYYSINGSGIYRFEPNEELNASLVSGGSHKCLNVLGDYLYFIDSGSYVLKRCKISGGDVTDVAENIDFAYLYNDKIYYVGTDNTVGFITISDFKRTQLYSAGAGREVKFAGISLSRIFFTQYDSSSSRYEYLMVDTAGRDSVRHFADDSTGDERLNLSLEGGYMYFYQRRGDSAYDLIRQKFGSEKSVTLLEDCSLTDYPVVWGNRLYYTELNGNRLNAAELNMNSMENKIIVSESGADKTAAAGVGYGYQYVYLFGKPSSSAAEQYVGSCIYTSSSDKNTIRFTGGSWKY